MLRFISLFTLILTHVAVFAQQDSVHSFSVYRAVMQQHGGAAFIADNGTHIVQLGMDRTVGLSEADTYTNTKVGYGTQWRRHGFGATVERSFDKNGIHSSNTYGLQYGCAIDLTSRPHMKNTRVMGGIGLNYTLEHTDLSKLTSTDQIDHQYGFIYPTQEAPPSSSSVKYINMDIQLMIRSPKFFASIKANGFLQPINSLYALSSVNEENKVPVLYAWNSGIKVTDLHRFTPWILFDWQQQRQLTDYRVGALLAYNNAWMASYQLGNNGQLYHHINISYYNKRIRVYAQYRNTPNPYFGYLDLGTYTLGVSIGIVKQSS